jgi:hypothetical protein
MARAQAVEPLQLVLPWTHRCFSVYPYDDSISCPSSSLRHPDVPAQHALNDVRYENLCIPSQHVQHPQAVLLKPLINKPDHHILNPGGEDHPCIHDRPQLLSQVKHTYCLSRFSSD